MPACLSVNHSITKREEISTARSGICAAASRGDRQEVQRLLDQGADANACSDFGQSALQIAAEKGHASVVHLLIKAGADANAQGGCYGNALQAAIHSEEEEVVRMLLNGGADANVQGGHYGNALQAAVISRMKSVVQTLLERGVDVNACGGHYGNALQAAAVLQMEEVVQWLLKKGADVNARGGYYGNALQAAAVSGNRSVVQLLLEKGADVNPQGGYYGNALQAAETLGKKGVAQALLKRGAINLSPGRGPKRSIPPSRMPSRPPRKAVAKPSHVPSVPPTSPRQENVGIRGVNGAAGVRSAPSSSSSGLREFVFNQLRANQSEFAKAKLDITAFCELRRVMKEQFAPGQILGSVVAITGSASDAQAATCAEYMNWKWPATGLALLRAIDNALAAGGGFGGGFLEINKATILRVSAKSDSLTLTARGGDIDTLADIAEGLGWICAAKRISKLSCLAFSDVVVTRSSTTGPFEIRLKHLEPIGGYGQDSCWHHLFKGKVIAKGFPIRERAAGGRGLDIPFPLMTFLAAVEFPIRHRDGLILMGFSTLLVPISKLKDNSIQWHMVVSDDQDRQILPSSIDDSFQWTQIDDLGELESARAILGWCKVAKVMLGTEDLKGKPSADALRRK
ncbi:hypothetical protein GP486_001416 [Trichoglossum hirsutum]|uniref:Ankyrin repeat protein n=1 Tax=Trichoglossum hirsutum TaxID=265104 RepID=A0A9P8RT24_9PEZI|nr:hypothetical protein GP486_001416 [Trichoglossum hirsutum]